MAWQAVALPPPWSRRAAGRFTSRPVQSVPAVMPWRGFSLWFPSQDTANPCVIASPRTRGQLDATPAVRGTKRHAVCQRRRRQDQLHRRGIGRLARDDRRLRERQLDVVGRAPDRDGEVVPRAGARQSRHRRQRRAGLSVHHADDGARHHRGDGSPENRPRARFRQVARRQHRPVDRDRAAAARAQPGRDLDLRQAGCSAATTW